MSAQLGVIIIIITIVCITLLFCIGRCIAGYFNIWHVWWYIYDTYDTYDI